MTDSGENPSFSTVNLHNFIEENENVNNLEKNIGHQKVFDSK
jgi:hypothetical protein